MHNLNRPDNDKIKIAEISQSYENDKVKIAALRPVEDANVVTNMTKSITRKKGVRITVGLHEFIAVVS